ncbi:MAG: sulfatase [Candidatus Eisenbacteria bacterium]|nr:sulfatase [Candidatus Eisenbacteria bacterium]
MSRRLGIVLLVGIALACAGKPGEKARGVLLVTIDTCRADRIGAYGNGAACTPTLDRLAREGAQFADCFVQVPTTLSSHATILTSLYPRTHGVPRNGFTLGEDVRTVTQVFAERGFRTAAFVGAFPLSRSFGLDRGFEVYDDDTESRPEGGELERSADRVTERAVEWLAGVGDEPFFLWVHYFDPHWPYAPPEPYGRVRRPPSTPYDPADLDDVMAIRFGRVPFGGDDLEAFFAAYDGEIAFVDRNLDRLLDAVPEKRRGDLLTVVTGDHGEGFGEHRYWFDHGDFLWESSIHVPLILHAPLLIGGGRLVEGPVRLLDLAPTILEAAGIGAPGHYEGESLMPALSGRLDSRIVISEASKPWNVEMRGEYRNAYKSKSVRTDRWKYMVTPYQGKTELYDLEEDPREGRNLIHREQEEAERLSKTLLDWIHQKDPRVEAEDLTADDEIREKLKSLGYF